MPAESDNRGPTPSNLAKGVQRPLTSKYNIHPGVVIGKIAGADIVVPSMNVRAPAHYHPHGTVKLTRHRLTDKHVIIDDVKIASAEYISGERFTNASAYRLVKCS